ncbi:MAG: MerR family transcriptional regulator [Anaerolineales bacterium]|nr:MerR family transcriptional regulator [Anaerolineales bacterium]
MARYLRTSDLARAVGVHVNTVRMYEQWGLIPPVERSPTGYRRFTAFHLDCLRLARLVYGRVYPGRPIRRSGVGIIQRAVSGDLGGALELAYRHQAVVRAERAQADAAAALLERWVQGTAAQSAGHSLRIGDTARLLGVTVDVLRNWERNGLLGVPRDPANGYRLYGPEEIGRARVIRMLVQTGYSLMAVLRMLSDLDGGQKQDLRAALDTPRPDEDAFMASDRWLTTLSEQETCAGEIIALLEELIHKQGEEDD